MKAKFIGNSLALYNMDVIASVLFIIQGTDSLLILRITFYDFPELMGLTTFICFFVWIVIAALCIFQDALTLIVDSSRCGKSFVTLFIKYSSSGYSEQWQQHIHVWTKAGDLVFADTFSFLYQNEYIHKLGKVFWELYF